MSGRSIHVVGLATDFLGQVDVVIPSSVEELHETDVTLDHPSSKRDSKGLNIRCPHCHNPIEVLVDTSLPKQDYIGRGILGQPKLYVPGQPISNVLRYLGP